MLTTGILSSSNSRRPTPAGILRLPLLRSHRPPTLRRLKAVPRRRKPLKAGANSLRVAYLPLLKAGAKQPPRPPPLRAGNIGANGPISRVSSVRFRGRDLTSPRLPAPPTQTPTGSILRHKSVESRTEPFLLLLFNNNNIS